MCDAAAVSARVTLRRFRHETRAARTQAIRRLTAEAAAKDAALAAKASEAAAAAEVRRLCDGAAVSARVTLRRFRHEIRVSL